MNSAVGSPSGLLAGLRTLMAQKGATGTPEDFYWAVNRTFHAEEARVYDRIHHHLWRSLPAVWQVLCRDLLRSARVPLPMTALDVGCGTGMAAAMLLQTPLAGHVRDMVMLDPSPEMLGEAKKRKFPRRIVRRYIQGSIDMVSPGAEFDLVVASSVLHHVLDLPTFLGRIARSQSRGGLFIHLQDPDHEALQDPALAARRQEMDEIMRTRARRRALVREMARRAGLTKGGDYIGRVNRRLLRAGVITAPLTAEEIWSVADIHVPTSPFSAGQGISLREMEQHLSDYRVLARCSYGFWGRLHSELPGRRQEEELRHMESGATGGMWMAAIWQKQS